MNLKTAITSALFAALAPCLQAQSVPAGTNLGLVSISPCSSAKGPSATSLTATTQINFTAFAGPPQTLPIPSDTCMSLPLYVYSARTERLTSRSCGDQLQQWTPANILACDLFSPEDVRNIDVHPSSPVFSEVQCTIYSDTGCAGDEYTVGADSHAFTKSFITGSFKCVVPRD